MKNNFKIIIAGGAGFVGSSLALYLNDNIKNSQIFVIDNLTRKGSKLNLVRLNNSGINFINADLSNTSSIKLLPPNADLFIDACCRFFYFSSTIFFNNFYSINH